MSLKSIHVLKIGGSLLETPDRLAAVLDAVASASDPVILVHGGGPQADRLAGRLGHAPVMVDGRRVTDEATLEIVTMVYAGLNSTSIIAGLAARGADALGLTGADLRMITAERRPVGDVDFGHVGDIDPDGVNVDRLLELLAGGITPVFSALTFDGGGGLLNTNADTIAAVVATALARSDREREVRLSMIMDAPGLLLDADDPETLQSEISVDELEAIEANGTLKGGILPKVRNACEAIRGGVRSVRIGREELLEREGRGTTITIGSMEAPDLLVTGDTPAERAVDLLRHLIAIPSLSSDEGRTADLIASTLQANGYEPRRTGNNVWARGDVSPGRPTILLNSHHDTVPPSSDYTRSPFEPFEEGGRLYGLGSNDAGGPLVSLFQAFVESGRRKDLPFNLLFVASAEEETSGAGGIGLVLPELGDIDCGIVGEPTSLEVAIAEKGLMVLECTAHGRSGHAARDEGENAFYRALKDIEWFRSYRFEKVSETLGPVHMAVTVINAGSAHNVVPDRCTFTVDVRTTDLVGNREALEIIRAHVESDVEPRSMRLNSSGVPADHPLVRSIERSGLPTYGSPTLSDQAQMPFPTIKFGPGDSARSHTPDEYIMVDDIGRAIDLITQLIEQAV